jgi:hypothetical protein
MAHAQGPLNAYTLRANVRSSIDVNHGIMYNTTGYLGVGPLYQNVGEGDASTLQRHICKADPLYVAGPWKSAPALYIRGMSIQRLRFKSDSRAIDLGGQSRACGDRVTKQSNTA